MKSGLVSISFRKLKPEEIVKLCVKCNLEEIEWGGDVHVPLGDVETAHRVFHFTHDAGLNVCCYGSYIRMTKSERLLFPSLIDTARALGAPSVRIWAGNSEDANMDEIVESTQMLSAMADDLIFTFEFHRGTLTHDETTASTLMKHIDRPNVKSQWQPPIDLNESGCLASIETMRPWLHNVHAFSWEGTRRLPLSAKEQNWRKYIAALAGNRVILLEFVKDDDPINLAHDAATLNAWLKETADKTQPVEY